MATAPHDTVVLTTPKGHDVRAELDYARFELRHAQAIHHYTGVITPLDDSMADNLARALRARDLYVKALQESRAVEDTLKGFGEAVNALGEQHPALKPYWRELAQHRTIAEDMSDRARHFHALSMQAIDRAMED